MPEFFNWHFTYRSGMQYTVVFDRWYYHFGLRRAKPANINECLTYSNLPLDKLFENAGAYYACDRNLPFLNNWLESLRWSRQDIFENERPADILVTNTEEKPADPLLHTENIRVTENYIQALRENLRVLEEQVETVRQRNGELLTRKTICEREQLEHKFGYYRRIKDLLFSQVEQGKQLITSLNREIETVTLTQANLNTLNQILFKAFVKKCENIKEIVQTAITQLEQMLQEINQLITRGAHG